MKNPSSPITLNLATDKLDACIHCGLCLPTCPTYRVTGSEAESPRGRLYLMRKMLEGELNTPTQLSTHLDQCLACHACETACPSGVQYGDLLFASREALAQHDNSLARRFRRQIFQRILPNQPLLSLTGKLLRAYQQSGLQAIFRNSGILTLIPSLQHQEELLPPVPPYRAFGQQAIFQGAPAQSPSPRVALMTGCVMDVFFNPVHWATIDVLVANGYTVTVPEQTCCGALAHHAGETDITKALAKENLNRIRHEDFDWIVLNSSGCGSTLQHYGDFLANDPTWHDKAQQFSSKVIDIMALLAQKPLSGIPANLPPQTLCYHAACHLHHVQGVKTQPQAVLAQIPNVTLVPLKEYDACCGSAGIYNLEHPQLAGEILGMKISHLQDVYQSHPNTTLVTGNPGCLMQIRKGLAEAQISMPIRHPVEVLAAAYRGNIV